MKVLIIGHSGMLGKDISVVFRKNGYEVYGFDLFPNPSFEKKNEFINDLHNEESVLESLKLTNPDIIIYTAAIVNLKTCEDQPDLAQNVHVKSAELIAKHKNHNTKFYYISTDSVFDGIKGDYSENDTTSPLNYYSKSKAEGEKAVLKYSNTLVIRTNIYGFNTPLKNSLAEWAIKNLSNKIPITGFDDVVFNAIYTKDLAIAISKLAQTNQNGLLNIACDGKWTKLDFLTKLAENLEFDSDLISEGRASDFNFSIPRPARTNLNVSKVKNILKIPTLEESLNNFCNEFKNTKS